jgi:6-pyruvoyltetrahydropterin/6-carboxytetrahydropterin synthase
MATTTIELYKENMKFSAGHFTIFSATERERLHGHNFTVYVSFEARMLDNGMCFDYGLYKDRIVKQCKAWNEYFILPTQSPHLQLEEEGEYLYALFNGERIPFLRSDVLLLPVVNATVEEFARLFLESLLADPEEVAAFGIEAMTVKVFSGPGQCAAASWSGPTA